MKPLEKADVLILDVLRDNARLSTREIAKLCGVPASSVYTRMKNMERNGIIEGYSAKVNKEKLGKKTVAYVLIRAKPGADQNDILEAAAKHEEVEDMAAIAGSFDIIMKVRVEDTDHLSEFLFKNVRNFKSVAQTETLITLNLRPYEESKNKSQGFTPTDI